MVGCCSKYSARMLREPIEFQRMTRTGDGAGGFTEGWAAITGAPTRAMVKALSGSERFQSQRTEATASHKIVVRYNAGLTAVDRAVIRGRAFQLLFLNNVDYGDTFLEITAMLGVPT